MGRSNVMSLILVANYCCFAVALEAKDYELMAGYGRGRRRNVSQKVHELTSTASTTISASSSCECLFPGEVRGTRQNMFCLSPWVTVSYIASVYNDKL